MDTAIAAVKAQQVIELQKQSEDKDRIITELDTTLKNRQETVKTIIKTVKLPANKDCIFDKDAINLLNKVR